MLARAHRGDCGRPLVYSYSMNTDAVNYKSLPLSERIQIVEDIWDSIAEETSIPLQISAEDRLELQRRMAAHKADPSSGIPWEQVRAALFRDQT
jgi:putative addiction module component (TIGR02574 family)